MAMGQRQPALEFRRLGPSSLLLVTVVCDVHIVTGRASVPAMVRGHIVRLPIERSVSILLALVMIGR